MDNDAVSWFDPTATSQQPAAAMKQPSTEDETPLISWPWLLLVFTVATALRFAYFTLDDLTRDHPGMVFQRLLEETTGGYSAMLLFPIIAATERRFPLTAGRWRQWPWHLLAWIPFTVLHFSHGSESSADFSGARPGTVRLR